jgi:hypothetical protein
MKCNFTIIKLAKIKMSTYKMVGYLEFSYALLQSKLMPGTSGHACNPNYSGGGDQEDRGSEPILGKEFLETLS